MFNRRPSLLKLFPLAVQSSAFVLKINPGDNFTPDRAFSNLSVCWRERVETCYCFHLFTAQRCREHPWILLCLATSGAEIFPLESTSVCILGPLLNSDSLVNGITYMVEIVLLRLPHAGEQRRTPISVGWQGYHNITKCLGESRVWAKRTKKLCH